MKEKIPEISNQEIIKDFNYKTDPRSSAPRQKLSGVYHYMLNYKKESTDCLYYVYGIPSFMDVTCGLYAVLSQLTKQISESSNKEQNPKNIYSASSNNVVKTLTFGLVGSSLAFALAKLFGKNEMISLLGFPIGCAFYYFVINNKDEFSQVELFLQILKFAETLVNNNTLEKIFGEGNIIIIKANRKTKSTCYEIRNIPEIETDTPNIESLSEINLKFYLQMWKLFQKNIQKIREGINQENYIPFNVLEKLIHDFKEQISELTNQTDKLVEKDIEDKFKQESENINKEY